MLTKSIMYDVSEMKHMQILVNYVYMQVSLLLTPFFNKLDITIFIAFLFGNTQLNR